jgi:hypothetical protein
MPAIKWSLLLAKIHPPFKSSVEKGERAWRGKLCPLTRSSRARRLRIVMGSALSETMQTQFRGFTFIPELEHLGGGGAGGMSYQ